MPRFFFDIADGLAVKKDAEGVELEGLNAARIEAVRLAGELLKSYPDRFWSTGQWNCTVRDETDLTLFILHFLATAAPSTTRS